MEAIKALPKNSVVLLNLLSNYVRFAVAIVCTVILTPILVGNLGTESFGLWTLVLCVSGYLELFDLGLTAGAMRAIATISFDESGKKNRLVNTLLGASLIVAPMVLLAGVVVGKCLSHEATAAAAALPWLIGLISIRVVLILPLGVLMGVLFGEHRIWSVNVIRASSLATFTIASIVAMKMGRGILSIACLYAVIYTLEYVAYGILACRTIPWLRLDLRQFDYGLLRSLLGFSASSFAANASNVLLMRTDPIIVSSFLSLGAVALYAVPMRIAEQLFSLSKQLINVFSPLFAQLHGSGKVEAIRSAYVTCSKFSFGMMIGIVVPATFFAGDALRFWIGDEFVAAESVLTILLAAAVLRTLQESSANALVMTGKHYFIARVSTASALTNICLSLALVGPFGIVGVAIATLVSVAVFGCLVTTVQACRAYKLSMFQFAIQTLVPSAIPAALQWLALAAFNRAWRPQGLGDLVLYGGVSLAVYAFSFRLLSLRDDERVIANRWTKQIFDRAQHWARPTSKRTPKVLSTTTIGEEPC